MSSRPTSIVVVGATGAVGEELLEILAARSVEPRRLRCLASPRSAGRSLSYDGTEVRVEATSREAADALEPGDVVFFSAGADVSRDLAPAFAARGATVIDNSSAFRMDPDVPLVVPEINGDLLRESPVDSKRPQLVANPNCSAILLVTALEPLRRAFGIEEIVVSTYQAVSGAGAKALRELEDQSRAVLNGGEAVPSVFREPCAFNVFSHDSPVDPRTGRNVEEQKIIDETRRIWDRPDLSLAVTCVRVPVRRAHTESILVTLSRPATENQVREALDAGEGVRVLDDREAGVFPTALAASGRDEVLVGRIRREPLASEAGDSIAPGGRRFGLLAAGDQLRKGAALNAVQIAERMALLSPVS